MSFVLAYSFSSIGFLLADTRLNVTFRDGQNGTSDTNPLTISLENGENSVWGFRHRKMAPIKGGYCAFAGDAITGRKVLDALIGAPYMSLYERALLVSGEAQRVAPWRPKSTTTNTQLKKSSVMFLDSNNGYVKLFTIDLEGNIQNQDVNYAVYWPPEIPENTLQLLNTRIINVSCPQSIPQLHEFILSALQLFQKVYQNSRTVSKNFEIGVLVPQPDSLVTFYGSGNSEEVIRTGVSGIIKILNRENG